MGQEPGAGGRGSGLRRGRASTAKEQASKWPHASPHTEKREHSGLFVGEKRPPASHGIPRQFPPSLPTPAEDACTPLPSVSLDGGIFHRHPRPRRPPPASETLFLPSPFSLRNIQKCARRWLVFISSSWLCACGGIVRVRVCELWAMLAVSDCGLFGDRLRVPVQWCLHSLGV